MPKITELWAWVIEDTGPEDEGVPTIYLPALAMVAPLMGADRARALSHEPEALLAARAAGKPIRLLRSTDLIEAKVLYP